MPSLLIMHSTLFNIVHSDRTSLKRDVEDRGSIEASMSVLLLVAASIVAGQYDQAMYVAVRGPPS